MATITDKFSKVSSGVRPLTTTVDGTRASAGTTLSCADLTGWDTDTAVHGVTYKLDGQGAIIDGSQIDFKGIVSGNTITSLTITGGTDNGNAVGDIVQATPTAAWAKDLGTGLLVSLDQDGTLKAGAVDVAGVLASNVVTTAKILDSNVTTAKIADDAITAAKLEYGIVRHRQGGTTGDAAWNSSGTNNTDTSSKAVFTQVGTTTSGGASDTTVTFPTAFTQIPHVQLTPVAASGSTVIPTLVSTSTTNFVFSCWTTAPARFAAVTNWTATGQ